MIGMAHGLCQGRRRRGVARPCSEMALTTFATHSRSCITARRRALRARYVSIRVCERGDPSREMAAQSGAADPVLRVERALNVLRGAIAAWIVALASSPAIAMEISTGFDLLAEPRTRIESLSRLYVGQVLSDRFSLGQALYSASSGDAGGAFFWGVEGIGTYRVGPGYLSLAGFVGGGGGAALYVGLTTRASQKSARPQWVIRSATRYGQRTRFVSSLTRSGKSQGDIALLGGEVSFTNEHGWEPSLRAAGAARGAEGYMEVLGGLRRRVHLNRGGAFVGAQLGFEGGGDVAAGGGLLLGLEVGASVP